MTTSVPPCARTCALVDLLLHEIARARGVGTDVTRLTYGVQPADGAQDAEHDTCGVTGPTPANEASREAHTR